MHVPDALIDNLRNGICIPWCGAGFSKAKGLPDWLELVRSIIRECKRNGLGDVEETELNTLLGRGHLDEVADYCRDFLGEGSYRAFLQTTFSCDDDIHDWHNALLELPFPAVFTSNYDKVIEKSYVAKFRKLPVVWTNHDTISLWRSHAAKSFFVLKVHGHIDRPETVVLTSKDYTNHIFANAPFMHFVQRVFLSNSILFMGTSLNDVYIKRILEETRFLSGGLGLPHFALFLEEVGPIRSRFLRDRYNVTTIRGDILVFLSSMKLLLGSARA